MRTKIPVPVLVLVLLVAACASTGGNGEVTGLVLDASGSRGGAVGRPPASWRVVDESGLEICSSEDLSRRNGWKGVYWRGDWSAVRSREAVKWIGRHPATVRVKEVRWSAGRDRATFVLDEPAEAALRELPAFRDHVRRADLAIILGGL